MGLDTPTQTSVRNGERGVSLLELAIFLPVILLIVAGVVDYGFALREVQVISSAAREGARTAASHSRQAKLKRQQPVACREKNGTSRAQTCDAGSAAQRVNDLTDSVALVAQKSTCSFLKNAGVATDNWLVSTEVIGPVVEDNTEFDLVKVVVERNPAINACVLCWEAILSTFKAKTQSTFALESRCAH